MSEDEDEPPMLEGPALDMGSADGHDMMGFGPLMPTDSERSLMERVRQELKMELKQVHTLYTYIYTHYTSKKKEKEMEAIILILGKLIRLSTYIIVLGFGCRVSSQE
jgi:hypothetical protein